MTNKKLGNDFEAKLCEMLYANGFWCHNLAQNHSGQPADVIAVRNSKAHLIDCKVCSGKGFAFSRIEENQALAMTLWEQCGNGGGWFALLFEDEIYLIAYCELLMLQKMYSLSTINGELIRQYGLLLEEWTQIYN
jgi:Holliday junction resolvase